MNTTHTEKRSPVKKVASATKRVTTVAGKTAKAAAPKAAAPKPATAASRSYDVLLGGEIPVTGVVVIASGTSHFYDVFRAAAPERIDLIKRGVAAKEVPRMAERMDTTHDRLMQLLGFPRTTVARKIRLKQDLAQDQAERFVGLSALVGQVEAMVTESGNPEGFDAAQWVARWLEQPNPALGNRRPAEYMDTVAGQELVSALIARMQSGAYA
ncbi:MULTISPECIES: type II RES/Xre toxin-antitoxin system antitoxin [Pandoraea]|uniref:Uncharacterized protein n=2 Tax=Pandoraea TaxID=93217 RepID=A0A5E4XG62_9BURK|nr:MULTISPECIES: antitoxin Xre/MbcA/ParS toxin-binding domain-containing protein [Pandoraea]VVE17454.1 hypothetical protein PCE31107_02970 [Pandoraea cepalis]VVE35256.1 hypothetical protein PTE31013_03891 [Pandoraea terrigena]